MTTRLLSLAVVLTAAGLGIGDDAEMDLKKLAGTWEEVSHTADGKARPAAEVKGRTVVIDVAGKWEAFQDVTSLFQGTVKLDPAQKPRAADWAIEGPDVVARSIYEVDGDMWKHRFPLTQLPTEFGSKEGSGVYYIVLKRVKK